MSDMVSVIIPVYNRQAVITECVHSVLAQTYSDFEVLLIDDGSTDDTLTLCRDMAARDPRIRLLQGEHAGVSAARNKGLESADGEYLFFLDSDDVIHPQLLEALVTGMNTTGAEMAGSKTVSISDKNWQQAAQRIEKSPGPGQVEYRCHTDALQAFFCSTSPINLIGGVMMRRDLVGSTRFRTDLFIGEDYFFVYENLIKGPMPHF